MDNMEATLALYMNTTALAFLGDAVFETYVRNYLVLTMKADADKLHRAAVKYVRAEAQAQAMKQLLPGLSEEELNLVKRARNKKISTKPKNADPVLYKWATAFEALIGYLYLSGDKVRMEEIITESMESVKQSNGQKTSSK
ncbi:MAG: ribonuclease III [Clostridiales bacterium]|nr:ribonuclease III [Clostridiales bacterium]